MSNCGHFLKWPQLEIRNFYRGKQKYFHNFSATKMACFGKTVYGLFGKISNETEHSTQIMILS